LTDLISSLPARAEDRRTRLISLLSSGTYTAATAQSTAFEVSAYTEGIIFVNATTRGGSSTIDITIQTSPDNLTWYTHTAMTQVTTAGQFKQAITNFGKYVRISYTVGGTSYIFDVSGIFKN
jgi:uncharacterized protein YdaL